MAFHIAAEQKKICSKRLQLLDQAVARDPLFFLAYAELAGAHDRIYFLGFDHTEARLKLADIAMQSVHRLASQLRRDTPGPRTASLLGVFGLRPSPTGVEYCPRHAAERNLEFPSGWLH